MKYIAHLSSNYVERSERFKKYHAMFRLSIEEYSTIYLRWRSITNANKDSTRSAIGFEVAIAICVTLQEKQK